jgi:hypothetical protein
LERMQRVGAALFSLFLLDKGKNPFAILIDHIPILKSGE